MGHAALDRLQLMPWDALEGLDAATPIGRVLDGEAAERVIDRTLRAQPTLTAPQRTALVEAIFGVSLWRRRIAAQLELAPLARTGFDSNGDVFGNNDRVGNEPRNTFKGDSMQTVDVRLERTFKLAEKLHLQALVEAFNLFNTVNIRYYNTSYGAADFCGPDPGAPGCAGSPQFYREGSPNAAYGTPSSVFNPRQLQFALRLTW